MTVFHGSNKEIQASDVSFSKNYLDFGKGFYITIYQNQTEKLAFRKELRYYQMNDQICIVNQEVLPAVLKFEKSYLVESK